MYYILFLKWNLWQSAASYTHLPNKKNIKVSWSQIEALILSICEAKTNSEDRQGQCEQASKDKQDGPYSEAGRKGWSRCWIHSFVTLNNKQRDNSKN